MVQSTAVDFFRVVRFSLSAVTVCSTSDFMRHEQIQFFSWKETILGFVNHLCYSSIVTSSLTECDEHNSGDEESDVDV
jgi:hypothetical protein